MTAFDPVNRMQRSAKTAGGFGIALFLSACSQGGYSDNYDPQTFYNSNDISFSIETDNLKEIEGHSILFSINSDNPKIEVIEKCSKLPSELSDNIPLIDNYSGGKCQQKYRVKRPSRKNFCFHLKKRKMKDELDDYENIFDDTSGFITIDQEQNHHLVVVNTDNDEENFFTYFSVENISPISCDTIK